MEIGLAGALKADNKVYYGTGATGTRYGTESATTRRRYASSRYIVEQTYYRRLGAGTETRSGYSGSEVGTAAHRIAGVVNSWFWRGLAQSHGSGFLLTEMLTSDVSTRKTPILRPMSRYRLGPLG